MGSGGLPGGPQKGLFGLRMGPLLGPFWEGYMGLSLIRLYRNLPGALQKGLRMGPYFGLPGPQTPDLGSGARSGVWGCRVLPRRYGETQDHSLGPQIRGPRE